MSNQPNTLVYKFLSKVIVPFLAGVLLGYLIIFALDSVAQPTPTKQVHLNSNNTVTFRGVVTPSSTTEVLLTIAEKVDKRGTASYPIYLVVDSPGGDVISGIAFIQVAKVIPNLHTITLFAASMAAGIVEALPGKRLITKNGELMFHRARGQFEGQFEVGELEIRLEEAKEEVRDMEQTNANRLELSLPAYKAKIINEWSLLAPNALKAKAADKVVDIVCSSELINGRTTISVDTGAIDFEFSNCPTFRYPLPTKKNSAAIGI